MTDLAARTTMRIVAAVLPWVLLFSLAALALECYLRYERFGMAGILDPRRYMSPGYTTRPERNCFKPGTSGGAMTPNCTMYHKGVRITTNSAGLHDHEVDEARTRFRVAVLGDSVTMAAGVPTGSAYHDVLEAHINRDLGTRGFVEFYNYGRGGKSTVDEVADLERALDRGQPLDAVLVGVTGTDFFDNVTKGAGCVQETGDDTRLTPHETRIYDLRVRGLNELSEALAAVEGATGLWLFRWPRELFRGQARVWAVDLSDPEALAAVSDKGIRAFRTCARRMRSLADERGLALAWAIVWYQSDSRAEILRRELKALGEPVVSMMDVEMEFSDPGDLVIFPTEFHPSPAVHEVFAERLYDFLGEIGWLARIQALHDRELRENEIVNEGRGASRFTPDRESTQHLSSWLSRRGHTRRTTVRSHSALAPISPLRTTTRLTP